MFKRSICILLMLIFVSQGCLAQDFVFETKTEQFSAPLGGMLLEEIRIPVSAAKKKYSISFFSLPPIEEYIVGEILDKNSLPGEIDLSTYNIHVNDFRDIYMDIMMKHPELLLWTEYDVVYNVNTGIVSSIFPKYVVKTYEDAVQAREDMAAYVKEYTDLAQGYDSMLEKLLVVHDKMVADCDYDVRVLSEDKAIAESVDVTVRHALGVFRHELAVCQGFAQAMYMILQELGLEVDFCHSDKAKHMWNYVKLDGKWYHLDMTNDDKPIKNTDGSLSPNPDTRASHRYFMVSDAGLSATDHGDDYDVFVGEKYVCDDAKYESDHFFNMMIPFTAKRAEDGHFHASAKLGQILVDFKSKSLYTGAVVASPCITTGKYEVIENGVLTEKEGRNLYMVQYATRDIPVLLPIIKNSAGVKVLSEQKAFSKDMGYLELILPEVDESHIEQFTTFFWDKTNLTPYAAKATWYE